MTSIAKEPTHSHTHSQHKSVFCCYTLKEQTRILQEKYITRNNTRPPQLAAQTIPDSKKINIGHEILKRF